MLLRKNNSIFFVFIMFISTAVFANDSSSRDASELENKNTKIEVIVAGKQYVSFQEYDGFRRENSIKTKFENKNIVPVKNGNGKNNSMMSADDKGEIQKLFLKIQSIQQKYGGDSFQKKGSLLISDDELFEMEKLLRVAERGKHKKYQIDLDAGKMKTIYIGDQQSAQLDKFDAFLNDEVTRDISWMLEDYDKKNKGRRLMGVDPTKVKTIVLE